MRFHRALADRPVAATALPRRPGATLRLLALGERPVAATALPRRPGASLRLLALGALLA